MNKTKRQAAHNLAQSSVPAKKKKAEKKKLKRRQSAGVDAENGNTIVINGVIDNVETESINDSVVVEDEETFEVENILDERYNEEKGQQEYFIKWKGWDSVYNSWEPEDNLACDLLLSDFKNARQILDSIRLDAERSADDYEDRFLEESRTSDTSDSVMKLAQDYVQMEKKLDDLRAQIKEKCAFNILQRKKEEQTKSLKEWEASLRAKLTTGMELVVENTVDLAGPPTDFTYVEKNIIGKEVPIASLSEHCCGCECTDCSSSNNCCPHLGGAQLAYNKFGKVRPGTGAIYECNKLCKCPEDCQNRMVQHGSKVKLCIFRTKHKGWGVKAVQPIKKDTFVVEYVGEVITSEEVDKRGHDTVEGRTYYFDLDFNNSKDPPYSIDASAIGNVSHFINHSCEPNLKVYPVWVDWIEPDLPRLALFATRDIKKGEELCFDYSGKLHDLVDDAKKEDDENSTIVHPEKSEIQEKISTSGHPEKSEIQEKISNSVKVDDQKDKGQNSNDNKIENGDLDPEEDEGIEQDRPKFQCYCGAKKCRKFVLF